MHFGNSKSATMASTCEAWMEHCAASSPAPQEALNKLSLIKVNGSTIAPKLACTLVNCSMSGFLSPSPGKTCESLIKSDPTNLAETSHAPWR